jgi:hypothetical protein
MTLQLYLGMISFAYMLPGIPSESGCGLAQFRRDLPCAGELQPATNTPGPKYVTGMLHSVASGFGRRALRELRATTRSRQWACPENQLRLLALPGVSLPCLLLR